MNISNEILNSLTNQEIESILKSDPLDGSIISLVDVLNKGTSIKLDIHPNGGSIRVHLFTYGPDPGYIWRDSIYISDKLFGTYLSILRNRKLNTIL